MDLKKIGAKVVKDSRGEETILVWIKSSKGKFITISPSGKSTGEFEARSYGKNGLKGDVEFIKGLDIERINELWIDSFEDLVFIERLVGKKIGANSLFSLEASLLKALAKEDGKELWSYLGGKGVKIKSVGNAIGGGLHSKGINGNKPDFQEFLFIGYGRNFSDSVKINNKGYNIAKRLLKARKRNDEGGWETGLCNGEVLVVMSDVRRILKMKYGMKVEIGVDVAASSFFDGKYKYKNLEKKLSSKEQIDYLNKLIKKYKLFYIEDGLNENDFSGFGKLLKKASTGSKVPVDHGCMIVGDDLTATNPSRLKKAIRMKSINSIIVKPNQIGSLLKVKEVIDIAKKKNIKVVVSHRSGETKDNTIADLAVGWGADFIKSGIYGRVRKAKLKRLMKIERMLGRK